MPEFLTYPRWGGCAQSRLRLGASVRMCEHVHAPPPNPPPPSPLPPVRVRQCGLSHSNGESEREEQFRANVAAASLCEDLWILPHREAFVAGWDGQDNAGLGSGGGGEFCCFFWGETAVLTVTHMQAKYSIRQCIGLRGVVSGCPPSARPGTPCPAPPGKCRTPGL